VQRLIDLAKVIRSKNAGPLTVSFDLLFPDSQSYQYAKDSLNLTPQALATLFGQPSDVVSVIPYPAAYAIKISMPRKCVAGSPGDGDVYGSQQHTPLLWLEL
jgi:hypothetical protein